MKSFLLLVRMAWRNLGRQRRRTAITVGAMAVGLALCIPTYALVEGLSQKMVQSITQSHLGHVQIHHPEYLQERRVRLALPAGPALAVALRDPAVADAAPRVYSGGMISTERSAEVRLQAMPETAAMLSGHLPQAPCEVAVDEELARRWHLDLQSQLRPRQPPDAACDVLVVSGVLKTGPGLRAFLRAEDAAAFAHSASAPPETAPDDIDRLERLPADGPSGAPAAAAEAGREKPAAGPPPEVSWTLVRSFSAQTAVIAVDPKRERQVTDMHRKVVAGAYLPARASGRLPPALLGDQLARQLMAAPGDEVGLDVMTADGFPVDVRLEVAGIFDSGMDNLDRALVFVPLELAWDADGMNLRRVFDGLPLVHEIALRLHPGADPAAAAARLQAALSPWRLQAWPWQKLEPSLASILRVQDAMVALLLLIIFAIASMGTMNTMLMSVFERVREFGVLKSVGMRPRQVAALILLETLFMTFAASVVGGISGLAASAYLSAYGLDFSAFIPDGFRYQGVLVEPVWHAAVTVTSMVIPVVLLALVSCVVAVWPAIRAARIRPVEAFRQQGV